jgi:hypothetical protein
VENTLNIAGVDHAPKFSPKSAMIAPKLPVHLDGAVSAYGRVKFQSMADHKG